VKIDRSYLGKSLIVVRYEEVQQSDVGRCHSNIQALSPDAKSNFFVVCIAVHSLCSSLNFEQNE